MTTLSKRVRAAIAEAPCSLRSLAREADIDVSLLSRIASGEREATVEVAEAVANALARWGTQCTEAARSIRRSIRPRRNR